MNEQQLYLLAQDCTKVKSLGVGGLLMQGGFINQQSTDSNGNYRIALPFAFPNSISTVVFTLLQTPSQTPIPYFVIAQTTSLATIILQIANDTGGLMTNATFSATWLALGY